MIGERLTRKNAPRPFEAARAMAGSLQLAVVAANFRLGIRVDLHVDGRVRNDNLNTVLLVRPLA